MKRGSAHRAPGHFGEFLQGVLGVGGPVALITLPCPALAAVAGRRYGCGVWKGRAGIDVRQGVRRVLRKAQAARFLARLGVRRGAAFRLRVAMPPGGGAGASTAARVALARAAGRRGAARVAAACLFSEGACDPLMRAAPERALWASRQARVLAVTPALPAMEIVGGFYGLPTRTNPRDALFADIADLAAQWPQACATAAAVARLASVSAARTLALRGPAHDPTAALAARLGALGWAIAHTGSARALIFAPGGAAATVEDALRAAGFAQVIRFRIGGRA
ncbi:MAG: propanediol utilization protein [Rhodobacterales bacterium]|nr:propanediol utilization protein [Rhodobacterales bacterium]